MDDVVRARETIRRWFDAAIDVVEPRRAVTGALSLENAMLRVGSGSIPLPDSGRIVVIAIGKAAGGMARGAVDVIESRIDSGVILTKYGHLTSPVANFTTYEAGHPVPDENSLAATDAILDAVDGLTGDDLVIALISGGGSALLERPVDGVSLEDMRETTRILMHAGADIHDLNAVRKRLSRVKDGGLRRAIGQARCVTLLLSDVLGNDPSVIASGPTVISGGDDGEARRVIERFGVRNQLPETVLDAVSRPVPPQEGIDTSHDVNSVVADNTTFVSEVARSAATDGYSVVHDPEPYGGDATELGMEIVKVASEASGSTDVIVRGGEATVEVMGDGTGGRNTEMALAAALALVGSDEWIIASLASDGDDGNSGAAGAVADGRTAMRSLEAGIDSVEALARNDSATVFRAAGGIVETGPTGTNVNDVYIAVRRRVFA